MSARPCVTENNAGEIDHAFRTTHGGHDLKKEWPGYSVKGLNNIQEYSTTRLVGSMEEMREKVLEEDG